MDNKNKPYRIKRNQIIPLYCYFCYQRFNEDFLDSTQHKGFPYHIKCIERSKEQPKVSQLVNSLLDYYNLFDTGMVEVTYIQQVLEEVDTTLLGYSIDANDDRFNVFLHTEKLFRKISMDYNCNNTYYEQLDIPIDKILIKDSRLYQQVDIPIRDMLFINQLF